MIRLTAEAHRLVRAVVQPGETAVDATAGNGHDTLMLAECVGPTGRVLAIDRQAVAIERTQARLTDANISHVTLHVGDHANLSDWVVAPIAAAMFNLGYLPHGDHGILTQIDTTLRGVQAAAELLRVGGILTIVTYRGHPGGEAETLGVADWCCRLPTDCFEWESMAPTPTSPVLFVVRRRG